MFHKNFGIFNYDAQHWMNKSYFKHKIFELLLNFHNLCYKDFHNSDEKESVFDEVWNCECSTWNLSTSLSTSPFLIRVKWYFDFQYLAKVVSIGPIPVVLEFATAWKLPSLNNIRPYRGPNCGFVVLMINSCSRLLIQIRT